MSDISGIATVMIWTAPDRYAAMRRFYLETLGLEPRRDRDGHLSVAWGAPPDDVRFIVAAHHEVDGPTHEPLRIMLNLLVRDIHATAQRLQAGGVTFSRRPEQESWGGWIATFQDPDGNTLQLLQPAEDTGR